MPTITNQNEAGKIESGTVLNVSGAASENEAILAVENYLREHQSEHFELTVNGDGEGSTFEIRLE